MTIAWVGLKRRPTMTTAWSGLWAATDPGHPQRKSHSYVDDPVLTSQALFAPKKFRSNPTRRLAARTMGQAQSALPAGKLTPFRYAARLGRTSSPRPTHLVRRSLPAVQPIRSCRIRLAGGRIAYLIRPAILVRTPKTAGDDAAWRRRCPAIKIIEMPGDHETLLNPENMSSLNWAFVTATRDWRRYDGNE